MFCAYSQLRTNLAGKYPLGRADLSRTVGRTALGASCEERGPRCPGNRSGLVFAVAAAMPGCRSWNHVLAGPGREATENVRNLFYAFCVHSKAALFAEKELPRYPL
jgi:hypothetical protein